MGQIKVHTAQNVLLEYPAGNIGQRLLAAFIDLLIIVIYFWLMNFILSVLFYMPVFTNDPDMLYFFLVTFSMVVIHA